MPTPLRLLRQLADHRHPRPTLSIRELNRRDRVLDVATTLFVRFGFPAVSFANLARTIGITPPTLRHLFADTDEILGEILTRHLNSVNNRIAAAPRDDANPLPARRAAYLDATRDWGVPTDAHLLLVRDRHLLPPDLLADIDTARAAWDGLLADTVPEATLSLLDNPCLTPTMIEPLIAALPRADATPVAASTPRTRHDTGGDGLSATPPAIIRLHHRSNGSRRPARQQARAGP